MHNTEPIILTFEVVDPGLVPELVLDLAAALEVELLRRSGLVEHADEVPLVVRHHRYPAHLTHQGQNYLLDSEQ